MHLPPTGTTRVDEAIVLAAGNGDRFRQSSPRSKLLTPIAGTPLLSRTLSPRTTPVSPPCTWLSDTTPSA